MRHQWTGAGLGKSSWAVLFVAGIVRWPLHRNLKLWLLMVLKPKGGMFLLAELWRRRWDWCLHSDS